MRWQISRKKETGQQTFDATAWKPAMRCSICTGEKVAGFKSLTGDIFREVQVIRSDADLEAFCREYGIAGEIERFY